ncbi:MAG: hypothetical protein ACQETH_05145 [Candidatus Rifleibacteriota bacterium]
MEPADFAVKIEEVMAEDCTVYECVFEDDNEIGRVWNFAIEDSISGYLAVEDNEETFEVQTVSVGLYLKDISDYSREDLFNLLYVNSEFINATLSVIKIPIPIDDETELSEEIDMEDPELVEMHDFLVIHSRIPLEIFNPEDFMGYVENMLVQYEVLLGDDNETDEAETDEDLELDVEEILESKDGD